MPGDCSMEAPRLTTNSHHLPGRTNPMPSKDEQTTTPTMYSIISRVGNIGSDAWTEARPEQRLPVRRILLGLFALERLTGWDLKEIPGRLGCNYEDEPLDSVDVDLLHDSGDFIDGLVRLLDGNRSDKALAGPSAKLVIDAQAAARRIVQTSPALVDDAAPISPRPGHRILGVTVTLVARSGDDTLAAEEIKSLVRQLVEQAATLKPEEELYEAATHSPLWYVAEVSDLNKAYDELNLRIELLKETLRVPST